MKRLLVGAGLLLAAFFTIRGVGPRVAKSAMKKCEEMMRQLGSDFPPEQMMERLRAVQEKAAQGMSADAGCADCSPGSTTAQKEPQSAVASGG